MHPPLSLIFFFVTGGTSVGLFTLIYVLDILSSDISKEILLMGSFVSLCLIAVGAVGASFHLGHKLRAWKAVRRFRTSWLSREAIFSGIYGALLLLYTLLLHNSKNSLYIGALVCLFGLLSAFSTAMIYASNRFVLEWHTPVTVLYFLIMYLMLGAGALNFLLSVYNPAYGGIFKILLIVLVLAFLLRLYFNIRQPYIKRPSLAEALNLPFNKPVRLVDKGTTTENYCTKEVFYRKGKERLSVFLPLAYLLTFFIPTAFSLYFLLMKENQILVSGVVFFSILSGSVLERWCFFVEGNHVQNLFYGLYPSEKS